MSYAHDKGYRAEHAVEALLRTAFEVPCYRPRAGKKEDIGDVCGLPAVFSVKDHARLRLGEWCDDLKVMVAHAGLVHGVVWHKRVRTTDPLNWFVTMPGSLYLPVLALVCQRQGILPVPPYGEMGVR